MDMLTSLGITKDLIADIIINIISIVVLFLIVKKLAYKPVKRFMSERSEKVMAEKQQAQELLEQAQVQKAECDLLMSECDKAKEKAIKEGEDAALKESEQIIRTAKEKAQTIIDKAEKKAQEKYDNAVREADTYVVNLAIDASKVLLGREVNDDDNKRIVEDFIKSLDGEENA
jgi:F-type H+-transporting ATPase subunit b